MSLLRWWWIGVCAVACATAQTPLLPVAAAYDASGNLFFVDANRNQVFEVALSGALTVVAGNGSQGFSGDGGAATAAMLNGPQGIVVGGDGSVYVADTGNQRVRRVSGGTITTFAGTGTAGFSGDGGAASAAQLRRPTALAVDASGAVLVCDTGNQRVRRIAGGVIGTIAGDGVQGFLGDGGSAPAAELNGPEGVAVLADGRVAIADTLNQRIRVVDASGMIGTIAGTGVAGYGGDGGVATAAKLDGPRGLGTDGSAIYVADGDDQRVRVVDAGGNLSTLAGTGVQGSAPDGTVASGAMLNVPRAVAVGLYGVAIVDEWAVRVLGPNGALYVVAPMPASRVSQVGEQVGASLTYGQGAMGVSVSGNAGVPRGSVTITDGGVDVGTAALVAGGASLDLSGLNAGAHSLQVAYAGDGINPAALGAVRDVTIGPVQVVASPNDATMVYGTVMPALSGSSSGVLARDAGAVSVVFATSATAASAVGSYAITAQLGGASSGNYSLTLARAATLSVTQAPTSVAMQPVSQSYAGLPLVLSATVSSTSRGTPGGSVSFEDNGTVVAQGSVVSGIASATYLSPGQGTHALTAVYSGDQNFAGNVSAGQSVAVVAMPDFSISAGTVSETTPGGLPASYSFHLAPTGGGPFTGVVSFSVAGLQPGAVATFSPASVVPGTSGADMTMSVQTVALAWWARGGVVWAIVVPVMVLFRKRRGRLVVLATVCVGLGGCGSRTVGSTTVQKQTYQVTVTGTATNLAGQVVSHSAQVTLIVE